MISDQTRPFAWSFSRLRGYQSCAKRFYHVNVLKDFAEEESDALSWGNQVHAAIRARITKNTPLPLGMGQWENLCIDTLRRAKGGKVYTEQKLGMNREFGPSGFFDTSVWLRTVLDLLVIKNNVALIIDWKTGRKDEESVQLGLFAAVVFAHQPQVLACRSEYHWLGGGEPTRKDFRRGGMNEFWSGVLPDVTQLEQAFNTTTFPARPSGLCRKWCPVRSCPHYGVG